MQSKLLYLVMAILLALQVPAAASAKSPAQPLDESKVVASVALPGFPEGIATLTFMDLPTLAIDLRTGCKTTR